MTSSEAVPHFIKALAYSEASSLNTLEICLPRPPTAEADSHRYWIVYIHGGAWRDPAIDATSFEPIQQRLLQSKVNDEIAGYASIDYRLSSYPSHPTNPSDPSDPARNARHPDHINDVLSALLYLQNTYGFRDQYVLVGHSCGATLALQVAMKRYWSQQHESTYALEHNVEPPLAIVGLEGIYDVQAFDGNHRDQPIYKDFLDNAVGSADWNVISPTSGKFGDSWPDGKLVVIAHSPADELVEPEQAELMQRCFVAQGWQESGQRRVKFVELNSGHDEVWQTGEAAKAIILAISLLTEI